VTNCVGSPARSSATHLTSLEDAMSEAHSPWMRLSEACEYARLSVPTLRRAIKAGRLEAVKVNGARMYRVRQDAIDAYLCAWVCGPLDREVRR